MNSFAGSFYTFFWGFSGNFFAFQALRVTFLLEQFLVLTCLIENLKMFLGVNCLYKVHGIFPRKFTLSVKINSLD